MQMNNSSTKYKMMLCKHYDTPNGCSYGDKCQFAHGPHELRSPMNYQMDYKNQYNNVNTMNNMSNANTQRKIPNPQNYKIVKCKNFENGFCKYGALCTFAHGETELRTKIENTLVNQGTSSPSLTGGNTYPTPEMLQMQMLQQQMMMNPNLMKEMQSYMSNMDPNMMNIGGMGGFDPSTFNLNMGMPSPYYNNNNPNPNNYNYSNSDVDNYLNMNNMYNYQNFPSNNSDNK